jgi:hypothetical protein
MRKINIFIANLLFAFHCLIGVFILSGWYFPVIKFEYRAFMIIWLLCWLVLGYCPVTKWEFLLRRKYDKSIDPNAESIQYYWNKFFGKKIPSKAIFTGGLIVFFVLFSATFIIH